MFEVAVQHVLDVEGGLVDDPNDPGGLTKHGISLNAHPELGEEGIRNLTREEAAVIYLRQYWRPLDAGDMEPRLAVLAFDAAVNHGLSRVRRWLRDHDTFRSLLAHRLRFYTRLESFTRYGRGWTRRVASVVDAADKAVDADGARPVECLIDHRPALDRLAAAVRGRSGPVVYRVRPLTDGAGRKLDIGTA